jgi:hypothetical protein
MMDPDDHAEISISHHKIEGDRGVVVLTPSITGDTSTHGSNL